MPEIHVDLAATPYSVTVERGILDSVGQRIKALGLSGKVAVISDETVAGFYADPALSSLESAGYQASLFTVPAGEASKSLSQVGELCSQMIQAGLDRSSFVVALGGGVVGDLAGFVASAYYRGIPFVQIPTTIVAQVDSAVGGKTGVNAPEGKNLIGAFHQPKAVFTDPETLGTLEDREFREGFAEVIKHAAIRDAAMLPRIHAAAAQDRATLGELIADNVAIKARIVEEDERETSGTRALLNFGHTIGHGIEASLPYGELLHGEAISLGIRAALWLSVTKCGLPQSQADQVLQALEAFKLPLVLPEKVDPATVLAKTATDKKFMGGTIKFVLLRSLGDAFVSSEITRQDLSEAIDQLQK